MKKYAKLSSMHIDNCLVDLANFIIILILTVHGCDNKNQNASNIINENRRDRQTG